MTSHFSERLALGTNYIYITRTRTIGGTTINSAGRWDGNSDGFEIISGGFSNQTFGGVIVTQTNQYKLE